MWDRIAERYRKWAELNRWYYRAFAREISKHVDPKLIIDICSGPGILKEELEDFFPEAEIVCIDSSKEMCRIAKGILADATELPFKNGIFDLAVFCFALHELDVEKALKEAERILKRNGILAIADLNSEVPLPIKMISETFLSFILGLEYATNLSKKWKDFHRVEEIALILEKKGFDIEHCRKGFDFWIIAKKI
ncbi:MAG: methyltransferase domain-containing protein [Archaeoglobaceae archaeon]